MSNNSGAASCAAGTLCLGATGFTAWTWAHYVWPAMTKGGVDFTGRVLMTVFLSGEYSVVGGVAATAVAAAVAGSAYCCYNMFSSRTHSSAGRDAVTDAPRIEPSMV